MSLKDIASYAAYRRGENSTVLDASDYRHERSLDFDLMMTKSELAVALLQH